jgi:hypothetical protein
MHFQRYSRPLSASIRLLEAAAPVFRRACCEPPEQLANLPGILLDSRLNLRHFAACDVFFSLLTGRLMLFRYDITYTPEMGDRMMEDSGLQCLHGVPGQFMVVVAWINTLREEFGTRVDQRDVAQIERELQSVRITPSTSADPFAVWKLVVQECWRQAVYIYLYMVSVIAF